ncbi:ABC transporter ATP-binding protein [soil metagenome]
MAATILSVESVSRRFGGLTAVDSVSTTVMEGQLVGLVGPNGAGKTTFFALVGGALRPSAGRLFFQGREVTGWGTEAAAAAGVARTFQVMRPFESMTVLENVVVGALLRERSLRAAREQARGYVELVGLGQKVNSFGGELSTGQRKRLELARAMATRPRLLLLDEVTAGVDQASIPGLVDLIGRVREQGVTLMVIEHNMKVIMSLADRIVALHLGRKIADGPPNEVVRDDAVVEAYLGSSYLMPS